MAGIGFRLQNLLREGSLRGLTAAYLYAAVIAAGPWLMTVLALQAVSLLVRLTPFAADLPLFRSVVTHVYAGALILVGIGQMGVTRHVADRLFVNDSRSVLPTYHAAALATLAAGLLLAGPFFLLGGLEAPAAAAATLLFQSVALVWVGMIVLSAAQDYLAIVRSFALGLASAATLGALGANLAGLTGLLWGFAAGHALLAGLLGARIRVEFPSDRSLDAGALTTCKAMPALIAAGFLYNLGIWIDKIIFWLGPTGTTLQGWIRAAPEYDTCVFFGYLTTIPALALFLIRIETGFYHRYAGYYGSITEGADLATLRRTELQIRDALRLSATRLLKLQGALCVGFLCAAPLLAGPLGLPIHLVPLLRLCILAAFLQILLMVLGVFLLYFDWQRETAVVAAVFCLLNAGLTAWTIHLGEVWYGVGYLAACLGALLFGVAVLERKLADLEYETFCRQPLEG